MAVKELTLFLPPFQHLRGWYGRMARLKNLPTLAAEEKQLVREALEHANAVLLPLVATLGVTPLTFAQRDALRDALLNEFCASGLHANDEPNPRGLALERLIDKLGHL